MVTKEDSSVVDLEKTMFIDQATKGVTQPPLQGDLALKFAARRQKVSQATMHQMAQVKTLMLVPKSRNHPHC